MQTIILSLGGSIIVPEKVDYFFLKEFKQFIIKYLKKDYRFVIFCGGGRTNSYYNQAAKRVSQVRDDDLDWIGIMATRLNAELVRSIFGRLAYKKVIYDPTKRIRTVKKLIIASGWKPGWSTDYDAVLLAKQYDAGELLNLTNIGYVYDKDPREHEDAEKFVKLSWKKYRALFSDRWSPRLSTPFDPIAAKEAEKTGLKVVVLLGTDLSNLANYLEGEAFSGTIIQ